MLENIYVCRHGYRSDFEDPSKSSSPSGKFHDPTVFAPLPAPPVRPLTLSYMNAG